MTARIRHCISSLSDLQDLPKDRLEAFLDRLERVIETGSLEEINNIDLSSAEDTKASTNENKKYTN